MDNGWIKLHRSFLDWEWFTCPKTCQLFIYCMLRANHTETKWRGVPVKRGQFLTSYEKLSSGTGLSVRNIRTALKNLESTGEVTRESTSQLTKLTICKYGIYNNSDSQGDKPTDKQATNERQTNDKQATTDKKEKNLKNEEEFKIFWEAYPKKIMKGNAEKTFLKIIKDVSLDELLQGLKNSPQLQNEIKYIPNAQAWLNGKGYLDCEQTESGTALEDVFKHGF